LENEEVDANLSHISGNSDLRRFEELVAELTASYICGIHGLETMENSTAYIASWAKRLKQNPEWFVKASSLAQKACKFILENGDDKE